MPLLRATIVARAALRLGGGEFLLEDGESRFFLLEREFVLKQIDVELDRRSGFLVLQLLDEQFLFCKSGGRLGMLGDGLVGLPADGFQFGRRDHLLGRQRGFAGEFRFPAGEGPLELRDAGPLGGDAGLRQRRSPAISLAFKAARSRRAAMSCSRFCSSSRADWDLRGECLNRDFIIGHVELDQRLAGGH